MKTRVIDGRDKRQFWSNGPEVRRAIASRPWEVQLFDNGKWVPIPGAYFENRSDAETFAMNWRNKR